MKKIFTITVLSLFLSATFGSVLACEQGNYSKTCSCGCQQGKKCTCVKKQNKFLKFFKRKTK